MADISVDLKHGPRLPGHYQGTAEARHAPSLRPRDSLGLSDVTLNDIDYLGLDY